MEVSSDLNGLADLPPGGRPSIRWVGVWLGPRAGPGVMEKRKVLFLPELEPPTFQPLT